MWLVFLPSLVVAALMMCLPSSVSFPLVLLAFPLVLLGWGLGRQGGGRDLLWGLGVVAIGVLGVVTAWQWLSVDPYAEEPAHLEVLFRVIASAATGYLALGVTFHLLRRRMSLPSHS